MRTESDTNSQLMPTIPTRSCPRCAGDLVRHSYNWHCSKCHFNELVGYEDPADDADIDILDLPGTQLESLDDGRLFRELDDGGDDADWQEAA